MAPGRAPQAGRTERLAPSLSPRSGAQGGGWHGDRGTAAARREGGVRSRRRVGFVLLALALALPPALAFTLWATAPTGEELEERWRRGARFDPLAIFPPREANASALRIEEIAGPLGLELSPQRSARRPRLQPPVETDLGPLWGAARVALRELRAADGAPPPLPVATATALDGIGGDLLALRETLLLAAPPRWERDLAAGFNAPLPDLLAHQRLHRLLVLAAYRAALAGEAAETAAWLEAAWRLHGSLADEPHLYAQSFAAAELGDELALLRVLPAPPQGWAERLAAHAVRPRMHRALRVQAWLAVRGVQQGSALGRSVEPPEGYVLRRLLAPLWWAYVRHGVGHLVTAVDRAIARAESEGAPALDEGFARRERDRVPRWSRFGRTLAGNLLDTPVQAARAELGVELTRQILGLAARRDGGQPPARATVPSAVPGVDWEHEMADGLVTVRASRQLPAAGPNALPLRAVLPWPATRASG